MEPITAPEIVEPLTPAVYAWLSLLLAGSPVLILWRLRPPRDRHETLRPTSYLEMRARAPARSRRLSDPGDVPKISMRLRSEAMSSTWPETAFFQEFQSGFQRLDFADRGH